MNTSMEDNNTEPLEVLYYIFLTYYIISKHLVNLQTKQLNYLIFHSLDCKWNI